MRSWIAILGLVLVGCYASHEYEPPAPSCDAGSSICLIDRPCWCRSEGAYARCFACREACGNGCEFRWGAGTVDAAAYEP